MRIRFINGSERVIQRFSTIRGPNFILFGFPINVDSSFFRSFEKKSDKNQENEGNIWEKGGNEPSEWGGENVEEVRREGSPVSVSSSKSKKTSSSSSFNWVMGTLS